MVRSSLFTSAKALFPVLRKGGLHARPIGIGKISLMGVREFSFGSVNWAEPAKFYTFIRLNPSFPNKAG